MPDDDRTPHRVPPGERDQAEGERDTVTPDVEAATRAHVKESREADRQNIRPSAKAPAAHDPAPGRDDESRQGDAPGRPSPAEPVRKGGTITATARRRAAKR
jgi:hypothetical protein